MLYAHFDKTVNEGQFLMEHMENVANQMVNDLDLLNFKGYGKDYLSEILYLTGLYHDIGKGMSAFQNYLMTGKGGDEKNHSLISAAIFCYMFETDDAIPYLAFTAIAKHHGDMSIDIMDEGQELTRLAKQYKDFVQNIEKENFTCKGLKKYDFQIEDIIEFTKTKSNLTRKRNRSDKWFFIAQYIFSKLIWADKLDSAHLSVSTSDNLTELSDVESYLHTKSTKQKDSMNEKREKIKHSVLQKINSLTDEEIKNNRIFTLTAPTGTGKTLTSICAALLLAKRIKKIYGCSPRFITALPFINILEQTKDDYKGIFGDVLVQYSASEYEGNKDIPLKDRLLLTNAWEDHVIITTFVQFFESILSSQNSRILKVNKLSGSIIILDEIQALPAKYYPLLGTVIKRISEYYGAWFILMTATQPEIVSYANLILGNDKMSSIELLEDNHVYYEDLERTKIIPVMDKVQDSESLVELISQTKKDNQSALVVINTISQSIEIYHLLKDKYRTLYLSTNLINVDRKAVIEEAKELLKNKIPFVMVSTQTIEAGVDLDFDIGYRDLAQLESIIQVAGRINRSGNKGKHCPLYVFETENSKLIYSIYKLDKTKELLTDEIPENKYRDLVSKYYRILLDEDQSYDTEIYEAIKNLDYAEISKFHLIDDKNVRSVIIEKDDRITNLISQYCTLIKERKFDFDTKAELKQLFNKISNYTVDIRVNKLIKHKPWYFKDIYDIDLDFFIVPRENVSDYYNETGFIVDNQEALMF